MPLLAALSSQPLTGTTSSAAGPAAGEHVYTTPGEYEFTVPDGVTSVSAVVIGGGGSGGEGTNAAGGGALCYVNNKSVTPGEVFTIIVGAGGAATTGSSARSQPGNDGGRDGLTVESSSKVCESENFQVQKMSGTI